MKLIFSSWWHNWISWGKTININPGKILNLWTVSSHPGFLVFRYVSLHPCCEPAWGTHLIGKKRDLVFALIHLVPDMYLHWWGRMAWGCEEGVKNGNAFFRGLAGRKIKGWWQIDLEQAKKSTAVKFMGFKCSWPGVTAFHSSSLMQKGNSKLTEKQVFFSCLSLCWHNSELDYKNYWVATCE